MIPKTFRSNLEKNLNQETLDWLTNEFNQMEYNIEAIKKMDEKIQWLLEDIKYKDEMILKIVQEVCAMQGNGYSNLGFYQQQSPYTSKFPSEAPVITYEARRGSPNSEYTTPYFETSRGPKNASKRDNRNGRERGRPNETQSHYAPYPVEPWPTYPKYPMSPNNEHDTSYEDESYQPMEMPQENKQQTQRKQEPSHIKG
jgi:hypothetical protein